MLQLPASVPGKAAGDGRPAGMPAALWDGQKQLLVPGVCLTQPAATRPLGRKSAHVTLSPSLSNSSFERKKKIEEKRETEKERTEKLKERTEKLCGKFGLEAEMPISLVREPGFYFNSCSE